MHHLSWTWLTRLVLDLMDLFIHPLIHIPSKPYVSMFGALTDSSLGYWLVIIKMM